MPWSQTSNSLSHQGGFDNRPSVSDRLTECVHADNVSSIYTQQRDIYLTSPMVSISSLGKLAGLNDFSFSTSSVAA